jgi:hypothetical protein
MLFFSHMWDGILKAVTLVPLLLLVVRNESFIWRLGLLRNSNLAMICIVLAVGALWAFLYRRFISTVATWLYATVSLGTNVSLPEAKKLRTLFQLDTSMRWIPTREIRNLPKERRRDALFAALERYGADRKALLL